MLRIYDRKDLATHFATKIKDAMEINIKVTGVKIIEQGPVILIFYAKCMPKFFNAAAYCTIGLVEYFKKNSDVILHAEVVRESSSHLSLETAMTDT